jgi:hypothetical protein
MTFSENLALSELMQKNVRAEYATDDSMAHAHCILGRSNAYLNVDSGHKKAP